MRSLWLARALALVVLFAVPAAVAFSSPVAVAADADLSIAEGTSSMSRSAYRDLERLRLSPEQLAQRPECDGGDLLNLLGVDAYERPRTLGTRALFIGLAKLFGAERLAQAKLRVVASIDGKHSDNGGPKHKREALAEQQQASDFVAANGESFFFEQTTASSSSSSSSSSSRTADMSDTDLVLYRHLTTLMAALPKNAGVYSDVSAGVADGASITDVRHASTTYTCAFPGSRFAFSSLPLFPGPNYRYIYVCIGGKMAALVSTCMRRSSLLGGLPLPAEVIVKKNPAIAVPFGSVSTLALSTALFHNPFSAQPPRDVTGLRYTSANMWNGLYDYAAAAAAERTSTLASGMRTSPVVRAVIDTAHPVRYRRITRPHLFVGGVLTGPFWFADVASQFASLGDYSPLGLLMAGSVALEIGRPQRPLNDIVASGAIDQWRALVDRAYLLGMLSDEQYTRAFAALPSADSATGASDMQLARVLAEWPSSRRSVLAKLGGSLNIKLPMPFAAKDSRTFSMFSFSLLDAALVGSVDSLRERVSRSSKKSAVALSADADERTRALVSKMYRRTKHTKSTSGFVVDVSVRVGSDVQQATKSVVESLQGDERDARGTFISDRQRAQRAIACGLSLLPLPAAGLDVAAALGVRVFNTTRERSEPSLNAARTTLHRGTAKSLGAYLVERHSTKVDERARARARFGLRAQLKLFGVHVSGAWSFNVTSSQRVQRSRRWLRRVYSSRHLRDKRTGAFNTVDAPAQETVKREHSVLLRSRFTAMLHMRSLTSKANSLRTRLEQTMKEENVRTRDFYRYEQEAEKSANGDSTAAGAATLNTNDDNSAATTADDDDGGGAGGGAKPSQKLHMLRKEVYDATADRLAFSQLSNGAQSFYGHTFGSLVFEVRRYTRAAGLLGKQEREYGAETQALSSRRRSRCAVSAAANKASVCGKLHKKIEENKAFLGCPALERCKQSAPTRVPNVDGDKKRSLLMWALQKIQAHARHTRCLVDARLQCLAGVEAASLLRALMRDAKCTLECKQTSIEMVLTNVFRKTAKLARSLYNKLLERMGALLNIGKQLLARAASLLPTKLPMIEAIALEARGSVTLPGGELRTVVRSDTMVRWQQLMPSAWTKRLPESGGDVAAFEASEVRRTSPYLRDADASGRQSFKMTVARSRVRGGNKYDQIAAARTLDAKAVARGLASAIARDTSKQMTGDSDDDDDDDDDDDNNNNNDSTTSSSAAAGGGATKESKKSKKRKKKNEKNSQSKVEATELRRLGEAIEIDVQELSKYSHDDGVVTKRRQPLDGGSAKQFDESATKKKKATAATKATKSKRPMLTVAETLRRQSEWQKGSTQSATTTTTTTTTTTKAHDSALSNEVAQSADVMLMASARMRAMMLKKQFTWMQFECAWSAEAIAATIFGDRFKSSIAKVATHRRTTEKQTKKSKTAVVTQMLATQKLSEDTVLTPGSSSAKLAAQAWLSDLPADEAKMMPSVKTLAASPWLIDMLTAYRAAKSKTMRMRTSTHDLYFSSAAAVQLSNDVLLERSDKSRARSLAALAAHVDKVERSVARSSKKASKFFTTHTRVRNSPRWWYDVLEPTGWRRNACGNIDHLMMSPAQRRQRYLEDQSSGRDECAAPQSKNKKNGDGSRRGTEEQRYLAFTLAVRFAQAEARFVQRQLERIDAASSERKRRALYEPINVITKIYFGRPRLESPESTGTSVTIAGAPVASFMPLCAKNRWLLLSQKQHWRNCGSLASRQSGLRRPCDGSDAYIHSPPSASPNAKLGGRSSDRVASIVDVLPMRRTKRHDAQAATAPLRAMSPVLADQVEASEASAASARRLLTADDLLVERLTYIDFISWLATGEAAERRQWSLSLAIVHQRMRTLALSHPRFVRHSWFSAKNARFLNVPRYVANAGRDLTQAESWMHLREYLRQRTQTFISIADLNLAEQWFPNTQPDVRAIHDPIAEQRRGDDGGKTMLPSVPRLLGQYVRSVGDLMHVYGQLRPRFEVPRFERPEAPVLLAPPTLRSFVHYTSCSSDDLPPAANGDSVPANKFSTDLTKRTMCATDGNLNIAATSMLASVIAGLELLDDERATQRALSMHPQTLPQPGRWASWRSVPQLLDAFRHREAQLRLAHLRWRGHSTAQAAREHKRRSAYDDVHGFGAYDKKQTLKMLAATPSEIRPARYGPHDGNLVMLPFTTATTTDATKND